MNSHRQFGLWAGASVYGVGPAVHLAHKWIIVKCEPIGNDVIFDMLCQLLPLRLSRSDITDRGLFVCSFLLDEERESIRSLCAHESMFVKAFIFDLNRLMQRSVSGPSWHKMTLRQNGERRRLIRNYPFHSFWLDEHELNTIWRREHWSKLPSGCEWLAIDVYS